MMKRVLLMMLMCLILPAALSGAMAEFVTPPPEGSPDATPYAFAEPMTTPLPTDSNGVEMELGDWYDWYYGEVLKLPNGTYKSPIREVEGRVQFNEHNLPIPVGEQVELKTVADFDKNSPALYTAVLKAMTSGYDVRSIYVERLFRTTADTRVDVLYLDPLWAIVRYKGEIGYVKRHRLLDQKVVDRESTPPYGVQKHQYVAVTQDVAEVRISMSHEDKCWAILQPGTTLSVWQFCGEWAVVNYWRTYGYIHISDLTDIRTVSPTDEALNDDTPIAAYTSYYKWNSTESIQNRIWNIKLGVERLSLVVQPGKTIDANAVMGPYTLANGYLEAGALVDGGTVQSPGGGTCQVSSTLYNVLLQLPGVTVVYRRAHGDNGAPYLPMDVDAAVGTDELNLKFRNDYDFPIRFEGHTNDDGALCWLVYRVFDEDGK